MTAILATDKERFLGISEAAEATGLSPDTLRWYEREGLLPRIERDPRRRRRYGPRDIQLLESLVRLRRSGMPVKEMREFIALVLTGPSTHPQRLALLAAQRQRVVARMAELQDDLLALDEKVEHYQYLIAHGLDCTSETIDREGR